MKKRLLLILIVLVIVTLGLGLLKQSGYLNIKIDNIGNFEKKEILESSKNWSLKKLEHFKELKHKWGIGELYDDIFNRLPGKIIHQEELVPGGLAVVDVQIGDQKFSATAIASSDKQLKMFNVFAGLTQPCSGLIQMARNEYGPPDTITIIKSASSTEWKCGQIKEVFMSSTGDDFCRWLVTDDSISDYALKNLREYQKPLSSAIRGAIDCVAKKESPLKDWYYSSTSFHITADFNGDGILDTAGIVKNDKQEQRLYAFITVSNTETKSYLLADIGNDDGSFYVDVVQPDKVETWCGKDPSSCEPNTPKFIEFKNPAIAYGLEEATETEFYWNDKTKDFDSAYISD